MVGSGYSGVSIQSIARLLRQYFSEESLNELCRKVGFVLRQRMFSAFSFVSTLLWCMGSGDGATIADLHRQYNAHAEQPMAYSIFHRHLDRPAFLELTSQLWTEVNSSLLRRINPRLSEKFAGFRDVLLHDGSSFAVNSELKEVFPGRFTTTSPAAVELHATFSIRSSTFVNVTIAADSESEVHFRPDPEQLNGIILVADRAFQDFSYFQKIHINGGSYVIRGKESSKPIILEAQDEKGRRLTYLEGKPLDRKRLPRHNLDITVVLKLAGSNQTFKERMILLYRKGAHRKKCYQRLHTNLPRQDFSIADIDCLYRYRWQIEVLFKELKSHTSLHKFNTSKPHIVQALILASLIALSLKHLVLAAAQGHSPTPLSPLKAARCASHYLGSIFKSILTSSYDSITTEIQNAVGFLLLNAKRSSCTRDQSKGSLRMPIIQYKKA
jgi:Transposase DDE domain